MTKTLRRWTAALAAAAVVLVLAAPAAAAAPSRDHSPAGTVTPLQLFDELVATLTGWLGGPSDPSPTRSMTAPGGPSIDPNEAEASASDDGGTATTQGGPWIDPDG